MEWIGVLPLLLKVFININIFKYTMSIIALKRKSEAMYFKKVSENGFYLNGKVRIPPPTLIRTPVRTCMKGNAPHAYGTGSNCRVTGELGRSCKNSYPVVIRKTDCYIPQANPNPSTKNTKGMLSSRFSGILHGAYPRSNTASTPGPTTNSSDVAQYSVQDTLQCYNKSKTNDSKTYNDCYVTKNTSVQYKTTYDTYMQTLKQNCNNDTKPKKVWHTCLL